VTIQVAIQPDLTTRELTSRTIDENEIFIIVPLLVQLYQDLPIETIKSRLDEIKHLNWSCFGVFYKDSLVGISGYWLNTRLYCGKYLYVDHFVVDDAFRQSGVGALLMQKIKEVAEQNQCGHICLDTFTGNSQAQKYWSKHKFNIVGFHYVLQH